MKFDSLAVRCLDSCDQTTRTVAEDALKLVTKPRLTNPKNQTAFIEVALNPDLPTDAFRVDDAGANTVGLTAQSRVAVLHGIGHILRDSRFADDRFQFGPWRGTSVPDCPLRGIYLAFHNNYYNKASTEELIGYFQELAMWGINTIAMHLTHVPKHDTDARARQDKINHALVAAIKRLGMKVGLLKAANIPNEKISPSIAYQPFPDTIPARRGQPTRAVCPSVPDGLTFLREMFEDYFDGYQDIGIDVAITFPYDAGGCGCDQCWPWGYRGYATAAREMSRIVKSMYPDCQFILPTWCFDVMEKSDGEWEGLSKLLAEDKSWVNYIMADSHEDFPRYPLENGVPGGLPMVNFAEISMWGRFPWGGFGANPLPHRMQNIWNQSGQSLAGGYPYSEGRFEDINKILFARFFWERSTSAMDTVRSYIAFEFGTEAVEPITEAIELLEKTYPRDQHDQEDVTRAYELLCEAERHMPDWARHSWRWRQLALRARIDYEQLQSNGDHSDGLEQALCELTDLNHLHDAWRCVQPPTRAWHNNRTATPAPLPPGAEN